MKTLLSCRTGGSTFLIIGSAFLGVALAGQSHFLPLAIGFIVLGWVFQARARRKSGA